MKKDDIVRVINAARGDDYGKEGIVVLVKNGVVTVRFADRQLVLFIEQELRVVREER